MPSIRKLQISAFRNISNADLAPSARLNLVSGENGSGKSSLLEAIHFLGLGRSFRNTRQTPLIQHGKDQCTVYAELANGIVLGVSRSLEAPPQIRIQGEKAQSAADLAKHLPLQLLNADVFKLLEGGPKARRQFIDWGVFHVEPAFHGHWREYKRCLQNRNILLRKRSPAAQLAPWTHEMARHAREIDGFRAQYLKQFLPFLDEMLGKLLQLENLEFRYYRGWNDSETLEQALENSIERDQTLGHTTPGPHRADLKIRKGSQYAGELLSRGQQKLLVCTMKLAQGDFLSRASGQQCLYLIDDLPSELDRENRQKICRLLWSMGGQVFITGTDQAELRQCATGCAFEAEECKLFHVKHGRISAVETAVE